MMWKTNQIGKILYALLFLVIIPAMLFFWAKYTENIITLPSIESKAGGSILMAIGGTLMLWGMYALKHFGHGLPMNAFPPPVFVTQGPYKIFKHPIYWGFGTLIVGFFVFTGSSSGLWMIAPLTILSMLALVFGYESPNLKQRFSGQKIKTIFDLPDDNNQSANLQDRISSVIKVIIFLIISNIIIDIHSKTAIVIYNQSLSNYFIPFNSLILSILCLIFLTVVPILVKRKDLLREWTVTSLISLSISTYIAILFPLIGSQYLSLKGPVLISVPFFLILISLWSFFLQSKKVRLISVIAFAILTLIHFQISRAPVISLSSSALITIIAVNYMKLWLFMKNSCELIANSWKEWNFGKVRVINHGFYVGTGAFLGVLLSGFFAGREYALSLLVFVVIVNICAALWAQIIEGSTKLKRPFGFYGGIVGILFGSIAVWLMGLNAWVVVGVASVVMPFIQAIGRFRCLVNGCCHGQKTKNHLIGIRYNHPRSRVCSISGLKGELVHPTQLYAILWLSVLGIFLLTLWFRGCQPPLIFGLYLILTGLGRFVEEAYRGEVQTPVYNGLHLYQWTAIASIVIGIVMTMVQIKPPAIDPGFNWETVLVALTSGFFVFFAMGVDFPRSNARFSRLV